MNQSSVSNFNPEKTLLFDLSSYAFHCGFLNKSLKNYFSNDSSYQERTLSFSAQNISQTLSSQLTEEIDGLLLQSNSNLKDVQALIITTGPASFTGTRIVLSYAQGLAYALKIPVIAVHRFEAVAHFLSKTHHEFPLKIGLLNQISGDEKTYFIAEIQKNDNGFGLPSPVRIGQKGEADVFYETEPLQNDMARHMLTLPQIMPWGDYHGIQPFYATTPTFKKINDHQP